MSSLLQSSSGFPFSRLVRQPSCDHDNHLKYKIYTPPPYILQTGASNERAVAEKLCGRSWRLEEAQVFAEIKLRVKLQLFVRDGGETRGGGEVASVGQGGLGGGGQGGGELERIGDEEEEEEKEEGERISRQRRSSETDLEERGDVSVRIKLQKRQLKRERKRFR